MNVSVLEAQVSAVNLVQPGQYLAQRETSFGPANHGKRREGELSAHIGLGHAFQMVSDDDLRWQIRCVLKLVGLRVLYAKRIDVGDQVATCLRLNDR